MKTLVKITTQRVVDEVRYVELPENVVAVLQTLDEKTRAKTLHSQLASYRVRPSNSLKMIPHTASVRRLSTKSRNLLERRNVAIHTTDENGKFKFVVGGAE